MKNKKWLLSLLCAQSMFPLVCHGFLIHESHSICENPPVVNNYSISRDDEKQHRMIVSSFHDKWAHVPDYYPTPTGIHHLVFSQSLYKIDNPDHISPPDIKFSNIVIADDVIHELNNESWIGQEVTYWKVSGTHSVVDETKTMIFNATMHPNPEVLLFDDYKSSNETDGNNFRCTSKSTN